jgi:dinuclear metal center YbgI/SA1388 family protein
LHLVPALREIVAALDGWFDPRWAESWDAVGLVCGDPDEDVRSILLAVDPVPTTVAEALDRGAQLLLTHHPLLLTPVHAVPASDAKGALVHRLVRAGAALFVAHTNADVAAPGVSDALADRIGLRDVVPIEDQEAAPFDKLVVFVPSASAAELVDALAAAGAGRYEAYERCAWSTTGTGTFRPLAGANPAIGVVGAIEEVAETRVEMVVPRASRAAVVAALRAAHPYEEPAFDLLVQAPAPTGRGTGRVGVLPRPMSLREFTEHVAARLPATAWGVRAAGDPDRRVTTVAVCGGSGAPYAEAARRAGADAYLTADLKHHQTLEATAELGMALVDAAHWATEAPWLDAVAARLRERFTVDVSVSRRVTDPWTLHAPSDPSAEAATT